MLTVTAWKRHQEMISSGIRWLLCRKCEIIKCGECRCYGLNIFYYALPYNILFMSEWTNPQPRLYFKHHGRLNTVVYIQTCQGKKKNSHHARFFLMWGIFEHFPITGRRIRLGHNYKVHSQNKRLNRKLAFWRTVSQSQAAGFLLIGDWITMKRPLSSPCHF